MCLRHTQHGGSPGKAAQGEDQERDYSPVIYTPQPSPRRIYVGGAMSTKLSSFPIHPSSYHSVVKKGAFLALERDSMGGRGHDWTALVLGDGTWSPLSSPSSLSLCFLHRRSRTNANMLEVLPGSVQQKQDRVAAVIARCIRHLH